MLVKLPISKLKELLMSQLQLPSLSAWTRLTVKLLQYMILEVELLIFLFLRFQVVYSRLKQQTETQLLEVKISIYAFNSSSLLNSSPNMVWISQVINLHSKESEKPLRRQRLNFHLLLRLMSILHIFQLITPDLNIFNSVSQEQSTNHSLTNLSHVPLSHLTLA